MTEVDLSDKVWRFETQRVEPGTPYPDEPSELIDPGWYVNGWSDDNDEGATLILRVDQAEDPKVAAKFVAERLSAATQTAEQAQPTEMVREFHEAFGVAVNATDSQDLRRLRISLIREEYEEVAGEYQGALWGDSLEEVAKELADLVYVVYGTAVSLGIDLDEALRRVHASNMSKRNPDGTVSRRDDGKILKPDTYRAPDMTGVPAGSPVTETTKQAESDRIAEKNALLLEAAEQLTTNADLMDRMKSIGDRVVNTWESLDGESTKTGVTTHLDTALDALRDLLRERPDSRTETTTQDSEEAKPVDDRCVVFDRDSGYLCTVCGQPSSMSGHSDCRALSGDTTETEK